MRTTSTAIAIVCLIVCNGIASVKGSELGSQLVGLEDEPNNQNEEPYDVDKHYLFVGGLQRSMTTVVSDILGTIDGFSSMKVTNMDAQELMEKKPWELGMGKLKSEDYFLENSGGVEGKMVQSVYNDEGHYVDFLAVHCTYSGSTSKDCVARKAVPDLVRTEETYSEVELADQKSRLLDEWGPFWDNQSEVLIEKTPENVFMTRWLQGVFGETKTSFLLQMVHPLTWSLAIDKWVKNPSSTLWPITSRIEAWLDAYEHLVSVDMPALTSAMLLQVESDTSLVDILTSLNISIEQEQVFPERPKFVSQGYTKHFCQGVTQTARGNWESCRHCVDSTDFQRKFDGTGQRELIAKYECQANKFGYSFWGLDTHCRNPDIDDDLFGFVPSLLSPANTLTADPSDLSQQLVGKHVVVFGHNFDQGETSGMAKRFRKIIESMERMGLVIHYICEECVDPRTGKFTASWFDRFPRSDILNVHDGLTTEDQIAALLDCGDDCLVDKIAVVVNFFTHLTVNISAWYRKKDGRNVKKPYFELKDGLEHESFVDQLRNDGAHVSVIVVSDDVHNQRVRAVVGQEEIGSVQEWARTREERCYGKADVVAAVSKEDEAAFRDIMIDYRKKSNDNHPPTVTLVPYTAERPNHGKSLPFEDRSDLLIAGHPHAVAVHSMVQFLSEVWPTIRMKRPSLRYKFVGKAWMKRLNAAFSVTNPSDALPGAPHNGFTRKDWQDIGIDFLGFVEQDVLDNEIFPKGKIFVVPHRTKMLLVCLPK